MARRKSLEKLLLDLRAECGLSLEPKANEGVHDVQVLHLNRIQENLWWDYDWPHLIVFRDVPIQAGQDHYAPPDDFVIDRLTKIEVRSYQQWYPLRYGIGDAERTAYDPSYQYPLLSPHVTGERAWPPQSWMIAEDERVQIWPIPDRDAEPNEGTLRFWGVRNLKPLVDADDLCDLDAKLIVLWTAAEILAARKSPDATYKLNRAKQLQRRLQASLTPRKRFRMAGTGQSLLWDKRSVVTGYARPRN